MRPETICIHAGGIGDQLHGALNSPIYTSSAYNYLNRETPIYPRYFNTPNQKSVTEKIVRLEGAEAGLVFSSGMAAISTGLLTLLKPGDHAVFQEELYGGTFHFVGNEFPRLGLEYSFVDKEPESFQKAIRPNTRLLFIETPSNPLLGIVDIAAVVKIARQAGVLTMIDNTFATPILQRPIELGIDMVSHSGTKYFGGHSDLCCGALVASQSIMSEAQKVAYNYGGSLDAGSCYLLERSLKTLALRVKQQSANALELAQFLEGHPKVRQVFYPGLKKHPGHEIAIRQMQGGFGGMLSFDLDVAEEKVEPFMRGLELAKPAVSLGGVESTLCSPIRTSHAKMSPEARAKLGITAQLLRVSVGIEAAEDLMSDFGQALGKI
jgi:cystathionine beta-lyase/cystathionine gamma-synthase